MDSLRLKIQFTEEVFIAGRPKTEHNVRFIHSLQNASKKTIGDLMKELEKQINQELFGRKIQIVNLTTIDDFVLNKSDNCSGVLKDNDALVCIDTKRLAVDKYPTLNYDKAWLKINEHDVSDNYEKCVHIGLNQFSKLYVQFRANNNDYGLQLFDIRELIEIATQKPRDTLICRLTNESDGSSEPSSVIWFIECLWEYDPSSNKQLFIICNFKLGAEENALSKRLQLLLDHSHLRIKKGEITDLSNQSSISSVVTDEQRYRLKELSKTIPPPKRSGPQIDQNAFLGLKPTKYECEGESSIRMACGNTNRIDVYQNHRLAESTTFQQEFTITHIIFSKKNTALPEILNQKRSQPTEKPVSVAGVTVFYQAHDGGWKECEDITIAPIPIRNEEPRWLTDSIINIAPDKLISFMIRGWIPVKGEPGINNNTRVRVHKNLPQPLKLKIVVADNYEKQCSLVVEKINPPLNIITRDSFIEDHLSDIKKILGFTFADDVEQDERVYLAIYINKKNELIIKSYGVSGGVYDRRGLRALQFYAKQNNITEYPFDEVNYTQCDNSLDVKGLFDPETFIFYGVRIEISTKTSHTEETIFVPLDKID